MLNISKRLLLILMFFSSSALLADSLTLQIIPPKPKLSWKNPRKLLISTLKATAFAKGHSIGHVTVHVKCDALFEHEEPINFMAGMTQADSKEQSRVLLKDKKGMGVIFHWFKGYHETTEDIKKDIPRYLEQRNRFATIRFKINHTSCLKLHRYWKEYEEKGVGANYGLENRPRYGEGAGCTAYATSYVELAGLLNPTLKSAWSRFHRVPMDLIGNPEKKVSLLKVLIHQKSSRWAKENEVHKKIFFYDTQPMWSWMEKLWDSKDQLPEGYFVDEEMQNKYSRGKKKKIMALLIDGRSVPTPLNPIWLQN